jgi:methanogenic corrinoid protein MtbC1
MTPTGPPPAAAADALRRRMETALAARDRGAAVAAALAAVEAGELDIRTLYTEVLARLMTDLGGRWQRGEARVWEEHLAAATVRTVVEALYPTVLSLKAKVPPSGHSVLLACPSEEAHDLGLRMLSDRFDLAGWATHLLGPDTPTAELAAAAQALGVDTLVLSSSTHFHRMRVRAVVDELKRRLPGVRVVVGGPAFAHDTEGFSSDEVLPLDDLIGSGQDGD